MSRLFVSGLAVAGLCGAVALGYGAPYLARSLLPVRTAAVETAAKGPAVQQVTDNKAPRFDAKSDGGRKVAVDTPAARVDVAKNGSKVAVNAPATNVRVDTDKGQVRVRAPFVNLDIRW